MHIISFSYKCSPGEHKKVAPLLKKKKGKKAGVFFSRENSEIFSEIYKKCSCKLICVINAVVYE